MHEISNNVECATSKASDQPAHMTSLIRAFASRLSILLTEHHLEFLSLKEAAQARQCQIVGTLMPRLLVFGLVS